MNQKLDIITIGESLIELSTDKSLTTASTLDKYYGGDTLTSAIAALRLGSKVGFISRIGIDCLKPVINEPQVFSSTESITEAPVVAS